MTVEEALVIIETALDYDRLNKVQELVFRQSWEGRSYAEIAKSADYEVDYIKDAGAKLWKLLSQALGEKVKKDNIQSVLKRYLRRTQVNIYESQVITVNLSGANLTGAELSGAKILFTNLNVNSCQADLHEVIIPEDKTYKWNGWHFRSEAEVKIAEALDLVGVLFIPNSKIRLTTSEGRQNQEPDFLIFHQGKWGILQVSHEDGEKYEECGDRLFQSHGIQIVQHYAATRCQAEPDRVVEEFLKTLNQL